MNPFPSTYILDLETVPVMAAADFLEEPSAPANYKDPVKIADYIQHAKGKALEDAGLDPDLARIVCLGLLPYPGDLPIATICRTEDEEAAALEAMRDVLESSRLVTYNGARFDLPLLVRRYWYLGLAPLRIELDRYRSPHVDLYERLSCRGLSSAHRLSWYAKRLGWPADCVSALTGADIAQAAREDRWDDIHAHCAADLRSTARLARWMGLEPYASPIGAYTSHLLAVKPLETGEPVL